MQLLLYSNCNFLSEQAFSSYIYMYLHDLIEEQRFVQAVEIEDPVVRRVHCHWDPNNSIGWLGLGSN